MKDRIQQTETIEWKGIIIAVTFEADWLNMGDIAHLQLAAVHPWKARLPMTEAGYRSHFLSIGRVEEFGGPTNYVLAWLDEAADTKAWREIESASAQLSLF